MRFVARVLALLSLAVSTNSFAPPPTGNFVIPGTYGLAPILQQALFPEIQAFYQRELAKALYLVKAVPPTGAAEGFAWEKKIPMEFYVTASMDPWVQEKKLPANQLSGASISVDLDSPALSIRQYFLFDRIYFYSDMKPKKGGFIELVMTVAYLNYGVIPYYMAADRKTLERPLSAGDSRNMSAQATLAAISYLERLNRSEDMAALSPGDKSHLPKLLSTLKQDLLYLRCASKPSEN